MLYPNNGLNIAKNTMSTAKPAGTSFNPATDGHNLAYADTYMMKVAERFDPFIQKVLLKAPRQWYNFIRSGTKPLFSGTGAETRIFRGGLGHYAGLDFFKVLNPVASDTNNPCEIGEYKTKGVAWERLAWETYIASWGSMPICLNQWKYNEEAVTQLAWMLEHGASVGIDIKETWNRDWLIRTACVDANGGNGRGFVMTKDYVGGSEQEQFFYDPLVGFAPSTMSDNTAKAAGLVCYSTGVAKPFIVFRQGADPEPINFDVLSYMKDELDVSCPDGSVGRSSDGSPMFGMPISRRDFENYVKSNQYELANWREARPEQLITGINGVKSHRDWAMPWDLNQLRFKITKLIQTYDSELFGGVGAALDGDAVVIAEYVPPRREGRMGENGMRIPEYNPEYGTAELAIAPVQMGNVFENLIGSTTGSLGSGTQFGPEPGKNGAWSWINIRDLATNRHGLTGHFEGLFEITPKPFPNVVFSTAILYKRCTQNLRSRCPVDNALVNPDVSATAAVDVVSGVVAAAAAAADVLYYAIVAEAYVPLASMGKEVVLTINNGTEDVTLTGVVTRSVQAPSYDLAVETPGTINTKALAADGEYYVDGGTLYIVTMVGEVKTPVACTIKSVIASV